MKTRFFILLTVVSLAIIWFGNSQGSKTITLLGLGLAGLGVVGSFFSARSKKGMGFFRRL